MICCNDQLVDKLKIKKCIDQTFTNRGTELSFTVKFDQNELGRLQNFWNAHLRSLGNVQVQLLDLPKEIAILIDRLNNWLCNLIE